MNQSVERIVDELRGAWRFRWVAMFVAWAVCIFGWCYVFAMPDVYEGTAKVYVDTRTVLGPLLEKLTVRPDVNSQLALVRQAMLGRPQLERVARETDLDLLAATPQARAALIDELRGRITIEGGDSNGSGGLYVIS